MGPMLSDVWRAPCLVRAHEAGASMSDEQVEVSTTRADDPLAALMGMRMLVGIAVSNGILLVHEANVRLTEGEPQRLELPEGAPETPRPLAPAEGSAA